MNSIEIPDRSFILEIASSWEELDQEQVSKILKLADKSSTGGITATRLKVESFYIIARIQRNWISVVKEKRLNKEQRRIKNAEIYRIAHDLTAFLFVDPNADQPELNYNSAYNLFPKFKASGITFFGPDHLLIDLTFGEFRAAFNAMSEYFSTRTEDSLNYFIACLYRPASKGSKLKKRVAYNSELIGQYAVKLKDLAHEHKTAVLLWFTTCIKYFQTEDLTINGKIFNLSPLFPQKTEGEKPAAGLGWTGILYAIAKDQVFGDVDKTESRNLYDVLLYMYDNHLQHERLKALSNKK